jgi:hypothetical protein
MIRFACPTCQKIIKAPDEGAGRKFPCPRCGQLLVVPPPLYQKNKPMLGLLLPEPEIPETYPAKEVSTSKSFEPVLESSEGQLQTPGADTSSESEPPAENFSQSNEPPPQRLELPVPADGSPWPASDSISQTDSSHQPPGLNHSVTGITTTMGAAVMFVVLLVFMLVCQNEADKIKNTPGIDLGAAQKKFNTLSTVAVVTGISSVVTSLFWLVLSFRSQTKRHWIVVGGVANGMLLIGILVNPMRVTISTSKTPSAQPSAAKSMPNRNRVTLAPRSQDQVPPKDPRQLPAEPAAPEVKPEESPAQPRGAGGAKQERKIIQEEEEAEKRADMQKQGIGRDALSPEKEQEIGENENRVDDKVAQLIKKLKNRNPAERKMAAEGLGEIGSEAEEARESLCRAMADPSPSVSNAAASALAKVDPALQRPVLTIIVDKQLASRLQALRDLAALRERGKPACSIVLAFAKLVQSPTGFAGSPNAILVIQTLMAIAPEDKRVFTLLSSCLTSENASQGYVFSTKLASTRALPHTPFKKESAKLLIGIFRSESDESLREAAAQSLGEIGPEAKDSVKVLEQARIDPSARVREAVAAALKRINRD